MPTEPVYCTRKYYSRLKEGEKPAAIPMLAYLYRPAVVIKTQLVVPDNRHCNAVTLSDHCATQIMFIFSPSGLSVTEQSR